MYTVCEWQKHFVRTIVVEVTFPLKIISLSLELVEDDSGTLVRLSVSTGPEPHPRQLGNWSVRKDDSDLGRILGKSRHKVRPWFLPCILL